MAAAKRNLKLCTALAATFNEKNVLGLESAFIFETVGVLENSEYNRLRTLARDGILALAFFAVWYVRPQPHGKYRCPPQYQHLVETTLPFILIFVIALGIAITIRQLVSCWNGLDAYLLL